MSVETSNRVWKQSSKGGTPLLLLLALADWSDDWGYCHPSIEQMAIKCRQTERNILNLIAANYQSTDEHELSGYLKSRIEYNRFVANGYVIHLKGADWRKSMPKNWKY
jgi:hypothetical protein